MLFCPFADDEDGAPFDCSNDEDEEEDEEDDTGAIRPSKYASDKHSLLAGRSEGSIFNKIFIKLNAFLETFPTYFFCKVSGRDMSGNFNPKNFRKMKEINE